MALRDMMTVTASTERRGAVASSKSGNMAAKLTNLLVTPVMLSEQNGNHVVRQLIGVEGTAVQIFEAYSESHTHTDSSASVTQMPDVITGDKLIVGAVSYSVKWAEVQGLTFGFGQTLMMYLLEDKRL